MAPVTSWKSSRSAFHATRKKPRDAGGREMDAVLTDRL